MKSRFKKRKKRYEEGGPITKNIDRRAIHPILTDEQTLDYQDYLIALHELDFPNYQTDPKGNQMSPASLNPGDDIRYNMNDKPGDIDKHKGIDRKNYFRNIYRDKDQHRWTPSDERDWQRKFPRNRSDEYAEGGPVRSTRNISQYAPYTEYGYEQIFGYEHPETPGDKKLKMLNSLNRRAIESQNIVNLPTNTSNQGIERLIDRKFADPRVYGDGFDELGNQGGMGLSNEEASYGAKYKASKYGSAGNPIYKTGGEVFPALKSSINRARNQGQFDINSQYYVNDLNRDDRLATGEAGTPMIDPIDLVTGAAGVKMASKGASKLPKNFNLLKHQVHENNFNVQSQYGPNVLKTRSLPMDYGFNKSKIDNFQVMQKTNKGPYGGGTQYSSRMNLSPPGTVYADDALNKDMWDRIIMTPSKNKRGGLVGPRKYDDGGWLSKAWSGVKNSSLFGLDNSLAAIGMPDVVQNQPGEGGNKSFFSYTDDSVGRQYQKLDAPSNAFSGLVGKAVATYYGGPAAGAAVNAVQPIQSQATNQNRDIQPSMNDQQVSQGINTVGGAALNMYGAYSGGQGKSTQFGNMSTGNASDSLIKGQDGTLYDENMMYAAKGGVVPTTVVNVEKNELVVNPSGKVLKQYRNKPVHPDYGIDPRGNTEESTGNIIIPRRLSKSYLKEDSLFRTTTIANLTREQEIRDRVYNEGEEIDVDEKTMNQLKEQGYTFDRI